MYKGVRREISDGNGAIPFSHASQILLVLTVRVLTLYTQMDPKLLLEAKFLLVITIVVCGLTMPMCTALV